MSHDPSAPTVLIIGGTAPAWATEGRDLSERALRQFKERGCRTVLTDTQTGLDGSPHLVALADEAHAVDFTDPAGCAAWAVAFARHTPVHAVVGYREYAVQAVAETAAALGVRGNAPETVARVRAKDDCRTFLRKRGFIQPELRICANPGEAAEFLAAQGGAPVVLKPRAASNSEGVRLLRTADDLAELFPQARGADGLVLAETFVEGPEYSVEGLCVGGVPQVLAVTGKQLAPGSFVEHGHTMPAALPEATTRETVDTVRRALTELDLRTGPFHVECWLTERGVVLGEVHVRQGGDGIHAMLEWSLPGLELYGAWVDDLLGRTPKLPPLERGAAVRFLMPPAQGTVAEVRGWRAAVDHPSVVLAGLGLEEGAQLGGAGLSNADRHGMLLVGGESGPSAAALADELIGRVDVRLR